MASPDPFLTLSNLSLDHNFSSHKKTMLSDRFMNEVSSIQCKLNFEVDSDQNNQNNQAEPLRKKGQKQKNYQSVLSSSFKSNFQPSYKSKIIRGGYLDFYNDLAQK